ncbi:flagellar M-ring protein FliF C-terminal domain-containing protein [Lachnospira multipara]|uniref:flagellar M-ring protein FliF C-terminal domain-containing protein n=1 Tax=Lachnospira multipara TaxID=28051 RepID=UPI0004E21C32|nr:flagellar M-ring protein FliF C-terminal domain-containing protein [Lachnospira multipara]
MLERLREIPTRILEMLKSLSKVQKIIIAIGVTVFIVAVTILSIVLSRPKYEILKTCADYETLGEVDELLTSEGIHHKIDNLTIYVEKKDLTNAKIKIASGNFTADGYTFEEAMSNNLTTTDSDRLKKYANFLRSKLAKDLTGYNGIKAAEVNVTIPEDTSSFYAKTAETVVAAKLTTTGAFNEESAEAIALFLAASVGNSTTNNVTITNDNGDVLFSGINSGSSSTFTLNSRLKYKSTIENTVTLSLQKAITSSGLYDEANIAINLDLDWDTVNEIATTYTAQEGREEGLYKESYELESTGTTGASGTPGTTSNDETTYDITDGNNSTSTYTVKQYSYMPNEIVKTTNGEPGKIIYDSSTIGVTLIQKVVYKEQEVKDAGLLDGTTWEQYKIDNAESVKLDVDNDWVQIIAKGTGITNTDNISVVAYQVPYFEDKPASNILSTASFWIQVLLAIAILVILILVVLRSTRPLTVEETEPELSVEDMLATTKEATAQQTVDDIDVQEKSETRIAIEKFVDENPEAVALLLRNWLNEDWN